MSIVYAQKNLLATTGDPSTVTILLSACDSVAFQLAGTFMGTVQFEATTNGDNYASLAVTPAAGGSTVTSATSTGSWTATGCAGFYAVRARCSAFTSGVIIASVGAGNTTVFSAPGGSDGQLLFNAGGSFAGMTGSAWDDASLNLTLTGLSGGSELDLNNAIGNPQIVLYRDDHAGSIGIAGDDGDINIDSNATETFIAGRGTAADFQLRPFHFGNGGQIIKLTGFDRGGSAYQTFIAVQNGDSVISAIPTCTISQPGANGILAVIPPTADPHVAGAIWNNAGTLTFSMG